MSDSGITVSLSSSADPLWRACSEMTNEIKLAANGRSIFPELEYSISGLDPNKMYSISLHFERFDNKEWSYSKGMWMSWPSDVEMGTSRVVWHDNGVQNGERWMGFPVSFSQVRITSKKSDEEWSDKKNVFLYTKHRFIPVLTIYEGAKMINTAMVPHTQFIAVSAHYNNALVYYKANIKRILSMKYQNHRRPNQQSSDQPPKKQIRIDEPSTVARSSTPDFSRTLQGLIQNVVSSHFNSPDKPSGEPEDTTAATPAVSQLVQSIMSLSKCLKPEPSLAQPTPATPKANKQVKLIRTLASGSGPTQSQEKKITEKAPESTRVPSVIEKEVNASKSSEPTPETFKDQPPTRQVSPVTSEILSEPIPTVTTFPIVPEKSTEPGKFKTDSATPVAPSTELVEQPVKSETSSPPIPTVTPSPLVPKMDPDSVNSQYLNPADLLISTVTTSSVVPDMSLSPVTSKLFNPADFFMPSVPQASMFPPMFPFFPFGIPTFPIFNPLINSSALLTPATTPESQTSTEDDDDVEIDVVN